MKITPHDDRAFFFVTAELEALQAEHQAAILRKDEQMQGLKDDLKAESP